MMKEEDFAVLCDLKARLEALEQRFPMNGRIKKLHKDAFLALCKLRVALNLTDEQFITLGGGTDKPSRD
jgi:hypothetical protein